jgi:2-polyprenyl-6-hydroxyphenyl methylase/3-demethylubiquinone-9 3-methyltransferase
MSAVVGAEYILGLLPRGTHDYSKFIKPSEIATELRRLNFNVVDISGMHYVPLINRCFLGDDTSVNYLLHARAVDG